MRIMKQSIQCGMRRLCSLLGTHQAVFTQLGAVAFGVCLLATSAQARTFAFQEPNDQGVVQQAPNPAFEKAFAAAESLLQNEGNAVAAGAAFQSLAANNSFTSVLRGRAALAAVRVFRAAGMTAEANAAAKPALAGDFGVGVAAQTRDVLEGSDAQDLKKLKLIEQGRELLKAFGAGSGVADQAARELLWLGEPVAPLLSRDLVENPHYGKGPFLATLIEIGGPVAEQTLLQLLADPQAAGLIRNLPSDSIAAGLKSVDPLVEWLLRDDIPIEARQGVLQNVRLLMSGAQFARLLRHDESALVASAYRSFPSPSAGGWDRASADLKSEDSLVQLCDLIEDAVRSSDPKIAPAAARLLITGPLVRHERGQLLILELLPLIAARAPEIVESAFDAIFIRTSRPSEATLQLILEGVQRAAQGKAPDAFDLRYLARFTAPLLHYATDRHVETLAALFAKGVVTHETMIAYLVRANPSSGVRDVLRGLASDVPGRSLINWVVQQSVPDDVDELLAPIVKLKEREQVAGEGLDSSIAMLCAWSASDTGLKYLQLGNDHWARIWMAAWIARRGVRAEDRVVVESMLASIAADPVSIVVSPAPFEDQLRNLLLLFYFDMASAPDLGVVRETIEAGTSSSSRESFGEPACLWIGPRYLVNSFPTNTSSFAILEEFDRDVKDYVDLIWWHRNAPSEAERQACEQFIVRLLHNGTSAIDGAIGRMLHRNVAGRWRFTCHGDRIALARVLQSRKPGVFRAVDWLLVIGSSDSCSRRRWRESLDRRSDHAGSDRRPRAG